MLLVWALLEVALAGPPPLPAGAAVAPPAIELRARTLGTVRSEEDLRLHFESHVKRVKILGLEHYRRHADRYLRLGIREDLVRFFLSQHDRAKLDDSPRFRARYHLPPEGPEDARSFLSRLWDVFGVVDPDRIRVLVRKLNAADSAVAEEVFRLLRILGGRATLVASPGSWPISPEEVAAIGKVRQALLEIERVADRLDRNRDPVAAEEFGRAPGESYPPLSRYLFGEELVFAEELAIDYDRLVTRQTYQASKLRGCLSGRYAVQ